MKIVRNTLAIFKSILSENKNLFCSLELRHGLTFKIWERPGHWCSQDELQKIINDIRTIVLSSTEDKDIPHYGVLTGDIEDLKQRIISIVYDKNNKPIAMSAQVYIDILLGVKDISVLHLGLVYVDSKVRGKSLTSIVYSLPSLFLMLKNGFRKQWVSNVTQVPAIFGLVQDFYTCAYPNTLKNPATLEHKVLAKKIFDHGKKFFGVGDDAIFDNKRHIILNSYTGGSDNLKKTFDECPPYRKSPAVNTYMQENLDYNRGDDVLQLAILDIWIFVRTLKDKVIQSFLGNFAFNIIIVFFMAIILPYLRWLIPVKENIEQKEVSHEL